MACVNGKQLSAQARRQVLGRYGYRWTVENERQARQWYASGKMEVPTAALINDSQWLSEHAFHVKTDGTLDERHNHAEPACMADDWKRADEPTTVNA